MMPYFLRFSLEAICPVCGYKVNRRQAITGLKRPLLAVLALLLKEKRLYS
jgi:hypothetical protein